MLGLLTSLLYIVCIEICCSPSCKLLSNLTLCFILPLLSIVSKQNVLTILSFSGQVSRQCVNVISVLLWTGL